MSSYFHMKIEAFWRAIYAHKLNLPCVIYNNKHIYEAILKYEVWWKWYTTKTAAHQCTFQWLSTKVQKTPAWINLHIFLQLAI